MVTVPIDRDSGVSHSTQPLDKADDTPQLSFSTWHTFVTISSPDNASSFSRRAALEAFKHVQI